VIDCRKKKFVDFRVKFSVVSLACVESDWVEWGYSPTNENLVVDIYASGNITLFNYQNIHTEYGVLPTML
jgi:hypothetical protein